MWSGYVRNHLLPRIFGFELLMAPYAVAHFKLGMQLAGHDLAPAQREKWAYDFSGDERLGVFLTNSLEQAIHKSELLLGKFISDEANAAVDIKRTLPILVVMGNPPYSGHSANRSEREVHLKPGDSYVVVSGDRPEIQTTKVLTVKTAKTIRERTFIGKLIRDYYFVDGKPLRERNPKWLQDDYVKFIRWGQWRIERTGAGVLAFITNHGYLDNPTFRGMRCSLINAFTEIYVLDLHGSSKKKETAPDGSADENVFDIQQGVTLGIFVKEAGKKGPAKVYHANLWGLRETKYQTLSETDLQVTRWKQLEPQAPFYTFVPRDMNLRAEYERGWKVTDAFPVNVLGFQTHRDHFAVDFSMTALRKRIEDLRGQKPDEELRALYQLSDNRDWQLSAARKQVRGDKEWGQHLIECLYRPFDRRPCYFSTVAMDYPRRELLDHVAGRKNLCLLSSRQQATLGYKHCWIAKEPANDCVVSTTSREANQVFPLYVFPASDDAAREQGKLGVEISHWPPGPGGRRPNLNPEFVADLEKRLGLKFVPEGAVIGSGSPEGSPTKRLRAGRCFQLHLRGLPLADLPDPLRGISQERFPPRASYFRCGAFPFALRLGRGACRVAFARIPKTRETHSTLSRQRREPCGQGLPEVCRSRRAGAGDRQAA
jgi:hypothetical protein